ncbi:polysaccharide biosynthesis C-terminal domain-containing protein [Gracilibacillus sp. JCM 18860]|uniref:polysaccharide biosynthesis C-terminal domain-containing protein n=1 Tax=Gracilibacillus sp. JCM 18860 TaxID=1306159 RepID=UPI000AC6B68A
MGGLFGIDNISIAGPLFAWYAPPTALTFAFFTVTCSILQGIEQQKFTLISLSAGILIKILLNSLMIQLLAEKGAVITTLLATSVAVFLNLWRIKTSLKFSYRRFRKLSLLMLIFTIVMAILLLLVKWLFGFFISYNDGQLIAFVITIIAVFIGGAFYMYFGYMSTLFERIVGKRIPILDRIFRR